VTPDQITRLFDHAYELIDKGGSHRTIGTDLIVLLGQRQTCMKALTQIHEGPSAGSLLKHWAQAIADRALEECQ